MIHCTAKLLRCVGEEVNHEYVLKHSGNDEQLIIDDFLEFQTKLIKILLMAVGNIANIFFFLHNSVRLNSFVP